MVVRRAAGFHVREIPSSSLSSYHPGNVHMPSRVAVSRLLSIGQADSLAALQEWADGPKWIFGMPSTRAYTIHRLSLVAG